jgi:hypothetical protein
VTLIMAFCIAEAEVEIDMASFFAAPVTG